MMTYERWEDPGRHSSNVNDYLSSFRIGYQVLVPSTKVWGPYNHAWRISIAIRGESITIHEVLL